MSSSKSALPVGVLEVERIDVLVLLGRILGVLHGAVRAPLEPLGMLGDVGMVRGALEGDVQRDCRCRGRAPPSTSARKSASLPSSGWIARWPPSADADGPRAAGIVRARRSACCSVPCAGSGRSDGSAAGRARRSPSPRSRGRLRDAVLEGAVAAGLRRGRARKQLVPGAVAGQHRIDHDRQLALELGGVAAVRIGGHRPARVPRETPSSAPLRADPAGPSSAWAQLLAAVCASSPPARAAASRTIAAPDCSAVSMSAGFYAALEVVLPGEEAVDPGRDGVVVAAEARRPGTRRASGR